MTAETDLLPLPEAMIESYQTDGAMRTWTLHSYSGSDMHAYARANVARAIAAKDAEIDVLRTRLEDTVRDSTNKIEALRAEVDESDAVLRVWRRRTAEAEARADKLAEALRELKDLMLGQVKWEPCDCGCPQQRTPAGPHSVTWLRAAQQVEIAISKAEGKE